MTSVCAGEGTALLTGLLENYKLAPENLDLTLKSAPCKGPDVGIVPETSLTDTVDTDTGKNTGVVS